MSPADIIGADLVLGMTRDHVRQVVLTDQTSFGRTFTLRDFVRRAEHVGPRPAAVPIDVWLSRVHQGRRRPDGRLGSGLSDDARRGLVVDRRALHADVGCSWGMTERPSGRALSYFWLPAARRRV